MFCARLYAEANEQIRNDKISNIDGRNDLVLFVPNRTLASVLVRN